eukprot:1363461-Pleurochrysis_carterae.AAC.1
MERNEKSHPSQEARVCATVRDGEKEAQAERDECVCKGEETDRRRARIGASVQNYESAYKQAENYERHERTRVTEIALTAWAPLRGGWAQGSGVSLPAAPPSACRSPGEPAASAASERGGRFFLEPRLAEDDDDVDDSSAEPPNAAG